MFFPLDDVLVPTDLNSGGYEAVLENKVKRINSCLDCILVLIFGDNWKEESSQYFTRTVEVTKLDDYTKIEASLFTGIHSKDCDLVNTLLNEIKDKKNVEANRNKLRLLLEEEKQ